MSKVRDEIIKFAKDDDKEILLALLTKYHWSDQWHFVANCTSKRYGPLSYETNKIWYPTAEGRVLFKALTNGEL